MEHHQVVLYLGALVAGAVLGLAAPAASSLLEAAVSPVLVTLLYTTFLGVPFHRLRAAFGDARFMAALVAVNFLVVPAVVLPLSRLVADESGLLAGTLLVLLAPCVDYVMVFTRLAGGAWSRILAPLRLSCSSRPSSCHCGWPSLPAHPGLREVVSAGGLSRRPSSS